MRMRTTAERCVWDGRESRQNGPGARTKLVVEPPGALGAAASLEGGLDVEGRRVGVILSGGNVDFSQVNGWLAQR